MNYNKYARKSAKALGAGCSWEAQETASILQLGFISEDGFHVSLPNPKEHTRIPNHPKKPEALNLKY